jgi:hypothetical protein
VSTREQDSLESALARTEADADAATRAAAGVVREIKRAKTAAAQGTVRELQRSLAAVEQGADALRDAVRTLRAGWQFDEREYLESGAYAAELIETARERGVRLFEQDERILSYPSVARVVAGDAALEIDRKRERRLRPSVVAEHLKKLQQKQPRFRAEQFLDSLHRAYRLALAEKGREEGATVRLLDLYAILTVLPGQAREYSKSEFARDLYLLEESGVEQTRDGMQVRFPAATGTKTGGTLATVTRDGELKTYFGIAFRA